MAGSEQIDSWLRHSFSTDGVDICAIVFAFRGVIASNDRSGLFTSTVEAAPLESTLGVLEIVEARLLLLLFSLDEALEMVDERRLLTKGLCLGLGATGSSFSILVWRDRTCFRAVSERLFRSRILCTSGMSVGCP